MARLIHLAIIMLIFCSVQAQDFTKLLPKKPPKSSKQNMGYLAAGLSLQVAGLGLSAASVYFMIEAAEEGVDIGLTGFGMGIGIATAGTVLVAGSVKNIVLEKRAWREYRKGKKKSKLTFNLVPTMYGAGIVCRF